LLKIENTSLNENSAQRGVTLSAGRSKAGPNIFARRAPLPGGAGRPKFNQLETVTVGLMVVMI